MNKQGPSTPQNIEKDHKDLHVVRQAMNASFWRRLMLKTKFTKNQRELYKTLCKQARTHPEKICKTFNKLNIFEVKHLDVWYEGGKKQSLFNVNINIKRNKVTALIGPSGCGKSTFIRCLNRINDTIVGASMHGDIYFDNGTNICSKALSKLELNTRVGMIFQKPTPFQMSVYDNVAFGPRSHGVLDKKQLDEIVESSLKDAALWDEVKDNLSALGSSLSGGQQQRLCIARAIALKPETLLMDEPTSGLDPISTSKIENLINKLKQKYTIIIVTHSMSQAQRVSDETIFFLDGQVIEHGTTKQLFTAPQNKKTRDYIAGKIG